MNQTRIDDPMVPVPIPEQVPAKEGMADLPGTRLGYWDTGGPGEPIVLLHPASGSALVWLYQQPVFAKAGYRVIAYSRRNYYNSDLAPENNPGTASADLQNLVEFLRVDKFHLVGSAAGGSVAADYALSHPERLLSLTVSSNNLAAANGYIADTAAKIRTQGMGRPAALVSRARAVVSRRQSCGRCKMDRAQPHLRDRKGRPAKIGQRRDAGEAGDIEGADLADDRRSRHVHAAVYYAHDCPARPRQRGRDRAGVRPLALLGATRILQPHCARIYR